jgi:hypothetical protein
MDMEHRVGLLLQAAGNQFKYLLYSSYLHISQGLGKFRFHPLIIAWFINCNCGSPSSESLCPLAVFAGWIPSVKIAGLQIKNQSRDNPNMYMTDDFGFSVNGK